MHAPGPEIIQSSSDSLQDLPDCGVIFAGQPQRCSAAEQLLIAFKRGLDFLGDSPLLLAHADGVERCGEESCFEHELICSRCCIDTGVQPGAGICWIDWWG